MFCFSPHCSRALAKENKLTLTSPAKHAKQQRQWDFSTELRLSRPAGGSVPDDDDDVLGVATTQAGTSYSLVADDPSTADGLFAFVRAGGNGHPSSSYSGPSAITRRATLLVDSTMMPVGRLCDAKLEKEKRKKEKKEKKEKKKKEKKNDKR